jgi:hypothetical protein
LEFCAAQSIPTDGNNDRSDNVVDLINSAPDVRGTPMKLKVAITTKISVASGSSSKLYLNLLTDASASSTIGSGNWVTLAVAVGWLDHNNAAGKVYDFAVPELPTDAYERYLALALEPVSNDTLYTAGAIDAWLEPVW